MNCKFRDERPASVRRPRFRQAFVTFFVAAASFHSRRSPVYEFDGGCRLDPCRLCLVPEAIFFHFVTSNLTSQCQSIDLFKETFEKNGTVEPKSAT